MLRRSHLILMVDFLKSGQPDKSSQIDFYSEKYNEGYNFPDIFSKIIAIQIGIILNDINMHDYAHPIKPELQYNRLFITTIYISFTYYVYKCMVISQINFLLKILHPEYYVVNVNPIKPAISWCLLFALFVSEYVKTCLCRP